MGEMHQQFPLHRECAQEREGEDRVDMFDVFFEADRRHEQAGLCSRAGGGGGVVELEWLSHRDAEGEGEGEEGEVEGEVDESESVRGLILVGFSLFSDKFFSTY